MVLGSNTSGHLFDTTFTTQGVLYSAASGVITSTANGTNGQLLIAATGAAPGFASLTSTGASITYTTGANSLNLDIANFSQGTFTPTIAGSSTAGTLTYDYQIGRYQKIGRIVTVSIQSAWSAKGTAAGDITCTNLPFTTANISNYSPITGAGSWNATTRTNATVASSSNTLAGGGNATIVDFQAFTGSSGGSAAYTFPATGSVGTTFSYETI